MLVKKKVHSSNHGYANDKHAPDPDDSSVLYNKGEKIERSTSSSFLNRLKGNRNKLPRSPSSKARSNSLLSCDTELTVDTRDDSGPSFPLSIDERDVGTSSTITSVEYSSRSSTSSLTCEPSIQSTSKPSPSFHDSYRSKPRKAPAILKKSIYGSACASNHLQKNTCHSNTHVKLKEKHSASFTTIEIRLYNITLGANPGGYQGPPISLDWSHDEDKTIRTSLDEYEQNRPPRRDENEMYLPECLRRWKLLEKGVSMKAMQKATKVAENTRRQRRSTVASFKQPPDNANGLLSGLKTRLRR